jgi:hypothetical protein
MNQALIAALILLSINTASAQQAKGDPWEKWQFLIGDWDGAGTGKPGDGAGGFSLKPDLDGNVLIRKNHADYPASNGRPAFSHNDLMIVYPAGITGEESAIYFDNEGHVINYSVSFSDRAIILTSATSDNSPRFKLSYTPTEKDKVNIKFEIAPPGKPDSFSPYIEALATRKR